MVARPNGHERVRGVRAPLTLRLYAVTLLVPFVVGAATGDLWVAPVAWVTFVIVLGLLWALLRGSRVAWVLFVALEASVWISTPFDPAPWWTLVIAAIGLVCLFAPPSRRFVWQHPKHSARRRELPHAGEPWGSAERR
jgi:hypothetical protein